MQTRPRPKRLRRLNRKAKRPRVGPPGLNLEPYQIVLRPLVTEKGTHQSTRHNAYCFEVHVAASKSQIKNAIQTLFPVRVESVNTQIVTARRAAKENRLGTNVGLEKVLS